MPPAQPTAEMGKRHEVYLAEVNAGRKSKASGSQWTDPADGRNGHDEPFALAWDGKSTLGKSVTITLDMIGKIREQALGEIPEVGLRWYGTGDLKKVLEDWVAVPGDDWREILAAAREWKILTEDLLQDEKFAAATARYPDMTAVIRGMIMLGSQTSDVRELLREAHEGLINAGEQIAAQRRELDALRSLRQVPDQQSRQVPRLPWSVVYLKPLEAGWWAEDAVGVLVHHQPDGMQVPALVRSVRVQRSMTDRPHLFVDNLRLRHADLYGRDGSFQVRVCEDDPKIEVG